MVFLKKSKTQGSNVISIKELRYKALNDGAKITTFYELTKIQFTINNE